MQQNKKSNTQRSRNWIFIVYPDTAPNNWREIVDEFGVPWAHSPLHDKDVNEYGGIKKAHYHCVIKFSNLKSYQQMLQLTGTLRTVNPQKCESLIGKLRYFTHQDNPEKYQYDSADIVARNGMDVIELLKPTRTETHAILHDMRKYIRENRITELHELYEYADSESTTWSRVIDKNTYSLNQVLTSQRHSFDRYKKR